MDQIKSHMVLYLFNLIYFISSDLQIRPQDQLASVTSCMGRRSFSNHDVHMKLYHAVAGWPKGDRNSMFYKQEDRNMVYKEKSIEDNFV